MSSKNASSEHENNNPSSDSKRKKNRIPFEGVFERIADRIKNQWLLFGVAAILVIAVLGLKGSIDRDVLIILVLGLIVLVIIFGIFYFAHRNGDSEPDEPEIISPIPIRRPWVAVMDLKNQGEQEKHEPQCFGVSSYLRRVFEVIPSDKYKFGVVPISELMGIKGDQISKNIVRKKTGARFLLEGHLDIRVDPCAIELRLSKTSNEDSIIWKDFYLEPWADIQATIKKIAGNVVKEVLARTSDPMANAGVSQVEEIIGEIPEQPIEIFEAFNEGIYYQNKFNNLRQGKDFREGEYHLKKAVNMAKTPFHDALSQLAFLYILRWETYSDVRLLEESKAIWHQILRTMPKNPFALAELGYVSYVTGSEDGPGAVRLAREAVERDPEHAIAHNVLALLYLYLGFYESNITIEENEVLPLSPAYLYPRTNAALAQQLRGSYLEALTLAQKALAIEPQAFVANLLTGAQYFYLGDLREAERVWAQGRRDCPEAVAPILDVARAWIPAQEGDQRTAQKTVQANVNAPWLGGPYGPYYISLCALAGDDERAIDLLEREVTFARSYRYLISEPTLKTLRKNPRFQSLLEKRHREWEKNLEKLEDRLPNPIDRRLMTVHEFIQQPDA